MIKANELRIGNLLRYDKKIVPITADAILWFQTFYEEGFYEPIPLTEEWMLKFGFIHFSKASNPFLFRLSLDTQRQMRYDDEGFCIETKMSGWIWRMPTIKFVHQLQNLYFALTGIELSITNPNPPTNKE